VTETNPAPLSQSYPAIPASVPKARHALVALAAGALVAGEQLEAIALAASEALTNVVVHAYPRAPGGNAAVLASQSAGWTGKPNRCCSASALMPSS